MEERYGATVVVMKKSKGAFGIFHFPISTSSVILPESPAKRVLRVLSSAGAQIVQTQQAEIGVRVTLSGGNVTVEFLNN